MRVFLDSNTFDWMLTEEARLDELSAAVRSGTVELIVAPEIEAEIQATPNEPRRKQLLGLVCLSAIRKASTHVPKYGTAKYGRAYYADAGTITTQESLAEVSDIGPKDATHLINATREACSAFVTCEKDLPKKQATIRSLLGIEVISPEELLSRIRGADGRV